MLAGRIWFCVKFFFVLFTEFQIGFADLPPTSHTLFPKGFLFGASTSSYQIEGAWNADGKGPNIWDTLAHKEPSPISGNATGDVAADSYRHYKKDVAILKEIGFHLYRFSLSWSRIFPQGTADSVNQAGVDYYNNLINELISNGIQPMVTLYHWDLPQALEDKGGWMDVKIVDYFESFADFAFKSYGDRVKLWSTINEFSNVCMGYGTKKWAPAVDYQGQGDYISCHNALKAHAKAYRIYEQKYKKVQGGKVGFSEFCQGYIPNDPNNPEDVEATERMFQFQLGRIAHPIIKGDYPPLLRKIIDGNSQREGLKSSRLPRFSEDEIREIKGSYDFFALNHYTSHYIAAGVTGVASPSIISDRNVTAISDPAWKRWTVTWLNIVPQGLRIVMNYVKEEYDNPLVIIGENGLGDDGNDSINDHIRVGYYETYLAELRDAIYKDGCNVFGYVLWSLLDNFEWMRGYDWRFGITHVDFNSTERTRTLKNSARWFKDYIHMHQYQ